MGKLSIEYRSRYHIKRLYTPESYERLDRMIPKGQSGLWFCKRSDEKINPFLSDFVPFEMMVPKNIHYVSIDEYALFIFSSYGKFTDKTKFEENRIGNRILQCIDIINKGKYQ